MFPTCHHIRNLSRFRGAQRASVCLVCAVLRSLHAQAVMPISIVACARTQAATVYTKEQKEGLLAAREALFRRMHQILEQRERLVATLQAGFTSTDTEHANAPLYVAVRKLHLVHMHVISADSAE